MRSCRVSPAAKQRVKWCSLFTTAVSTPLIYTKLAIDRVTSIFDIKAILKASDEAVLLVTDTATKFNIDSRYPEDVFNATVVEFPLTLHALGKSQIPVYLSTLPGHVAAGFEKEAWIAAGFASLLAGAAVAYQWYYTPPATEAVSSETHLLDRKASDVDLEESERRFVMK